MKGEHVRGSFVNGRVSSLGLALLVYETRPRVGCSPLLATWAGPESPSPATHAPYTTYVHPSTDQSRGLCTYARSPPHGHLAGDATPNHRVGGTSLIRIASRPALEPGWDGGNERIGVQWHSASSPTRAASARLGDETRVDATSNRPCAASQLSLLRRP